MNIKKALCESILCDPLWWNVCWFLSNGVLLGRRAYILYVEEGKSASQKFVLRSNSLGYASLWCIFAILTIVFVVFSEDPGEGVNAIGVLLVEFVAICLWRPYFGNGDLIQHVVQQTRNRMRFLLVQGLGLNATECARYWDANENAIVALWTRHLKDKRWKQFTPKERNALLFDTGIECGKVLEDNTWEGVLYDVAAFFQEWRTEVEESRPLRVPEHIASSMIHGNDAGSQALLSVAVLVANEDPELRRTRDWDERLASRQFSAARIAKRKTAGEGILRWPDCVAQQPRFEIRGCDVDMTDLKIVDGSHIMPCHGIRCLPASILYTLLEIVQCGYLRCQADGTIQADLTFKYGNMVFNKDQWDPLRSIQRKPFRYITSATWMAGDVAFVVEQREITGSAAELDGSGYLSGTLRLRFNVDVVDEETSWVERSYPSTKENETIWGDVGEMECTNCTIHVLNKPMAALICVSWLLTLMAVWLMKMAWYGLICSCRCFSSFFVDPASAAKPNTMPVIPTAKTCRKTAAEMLVMSKSGRDNETTVHRAETMELVQRLGSWISGSAREANQNDTVEQCPV